MTTNGTNPDIWIEGKLYTWSEVCIDETAGFDLQEDGTLKPNKIGRYVIK